MYEQRYRRLLENFRDDFGHSYDLILEFSEDLVAQGISLSRLCAYLFWLHKSLSVVDKPVREWSKLEVREVINEMQIATKNGSLSENSLRETKKTLKKFFKWLGREELVNWFSTGSVETKVTPQDLITEEEFNAMIGACMNSRDRALISLLYESGPRIGEVGSMKVKDVSFDEHGAIVWLPKSKTAKRKLRVVYSARYLSEWLVDHPNNDLESPLWAKLAGKNRQQGMVYDDLRIQIKKVAKRAGIKKRVYPHLFRHTRATKLLTKVPESIGARYMGWVPGSDMVKTYVHLASEDVDEAILKMHGIKSNGNGKDLEVKQCPRCTQINPDSRYCSRCGLPLTEEAAQEVDEWENRKADALNQLSNPDMLKMMMDMQQEIDRLKGKIKEMREE